MDSKKMREYKYIRNTLPITNKTIALDSSNTRPVFYIESDKYNFILGMTWEDWVNSEFNTENAVISGKWVDFKNFMLMDSSGTQVYPNDPVKENYTYKQG